MDYPSLKKNFLPKQKKTVTTELFALKVFENNLEWPRFGFSVSKDVDNKAVARNRVKRIFRSVAHENLSRIKKGNDFLFIIRKKSGAATRKEIFEVFLNTLRKENLLNEKSNNIRS